MIRNLFLGLFAFVFLQSCTTSQGAMQGEPKQDNFEWNAANVYFVLPDRFQNGDPSNDLSYGRKNDAATLRGFEGGDLRGIIQKLDEGYFRDLGINAIWMTPVVEQIQGSVDEGTGKSYGFHGYWTRDWTSLEKNLGTKEDLKELVDKAHAQGIRVLLDAVINHTGPVTPIDAVFPRDWVRTSPQCTYQGYSTTIPCTLVANLPDILTESEKEVALPEVLVSKWKKEGRYEKEMQELDTFFARTGYPKAPKYYIMKWLSDYILEFGIDGYRVDTVKHTEEDVWKSFQKVAEASFQEYKEKNPAKVLDDSPFFLVGEVYGYGISQDQLYNFNDKKVNYFENGFQALINFDFKGDANKTYEELFSYYDQKLKGPLKGLSVMNYLSSHDDGSPFDKDRTRTLESATKLLLSPGIAQVYYGDESARPLQVAGAEGDANLRSKMNWDEISSDPSTQRLVEHYGKLGRFRRDHVAVGLGAHQMLSSAPYTFSRVYNRDKVVIGLDHPIGAKKIEVKGVFAEGATLRDAYSGKTGEVQMGVVELDTPYTTVLLEKL